MIRIIFWNVNKQNLSELVCAMADTTKADIVVLNECRTPILETLNSLRANVSQTFYVPKSASEKRFQLFCRTSSLGLDEVNAGFRISFRTMQTGGNSIILGLVHGVDVRNYDKEHRQEFAHDLALDIAFVKKEHATNRLVLLGDFNMNPYDSGMNLASGLNAVMTRTCASAGIRRYLGKDYDFYYNPMWSLFGDNSTGPAGTIYDTSSQGPYGWSMFDQVLLNHTIVNLFDNVEILTTAGRFSLADDKGRPDTRKASNHFPILISLKGN